MKYAASMRYAGMLVDAIDADYTSYKRLGLLCPNCHAPVFLVSGSDRQDSTRTIVDKTTGFKKQVPVTGASVEAHFSHFRDVSEEQVKQCELRVKSLKPSEFQKRSIAARNQRERFFRSHFWKILEMGYKMERWEEDVSFARSGFIASCPAKDPENYRELKWTKFTEMFVGSFNANKVHLIGIANRCIDSIISVDCSDYADRSRDEGFIWESKVISCLQQFQQAIDAKMQVEIVKEAIEFLGHKRNQEILRILFAKSLADYAMESDDRLLPERFLVPCAFDERYLAAQVSLYTERFESLHAWNPKQIERVMEWIGTNIAVILATTPWADGFEKLEENNASPIRTELSSHSLGIWHYTVNSGHTSFQPFSKLPKTPIDSLEKAIASIAGGGTLTKSLPHPYNEYSVMVTVERRKIGAALFDIGKGKTPHESFMLTAALAWTKEGEDVLTEILPAMERTISPWSMCSFKKPEKLPWLAVFLMPNPELATCHWLANAEFAIAKFLIQSAS